MLPQLALLLVLDLALPVVADRVGPRIRDRFERAGPLGRLAMAGVGVAAAVAVASRPRLARGVAVLAATGLQRAQSRIG